jgi:hypothetical protein
MTAAAIALWAESAPAQDPPAKACGATYAEAHDQREAGHVQEARALLLRCAKPACGRLKKTCAREAARLATSVAWIAPTVKDAGGGPLDDVRVSVDGVPLAEQSGNRPFAIDPGAHDVTFEARTFGQVVSKTEKVTVAPGQHEVLAVRLPWPDANEGQLRPAARGLPTEDSSVGGTDTPAKPVADAPPPASDSKPTESAPPEHAPEGPPPLPARRGGPSALAFVLGGTGLLGLGAGALATYWGKTDNDSLAHCAPNCQSASIGHVRELYIAADVAYGVGAAALLASAFFFVTSRSTEVPPQAQRAQSASFGWDVQPTRTGAVATFQARF